MSKILLKIKSVLLGTLVVVCLCSCGKDTVYYVESENEDSSVQQDSESDTTEDKEKGDGESASIYVYVCGQVAQPGVYILPEGSRVCDLFEMAGGFTQAAATDYWNQARLLTDGEMLYVPTAEEVEDRQFDGDTTSQNSTDDTNKVNINTASKEELMTLPGIGEAKALAIIAYRQENGPFSSLEELKEVEGIKDGVFSKMKDYIEID